MLNIPGRPTSYAKVISEIDKSLNKAFEEDKSQIQNPLDGEGKNKITRETAFPLEFTECKGRDIKYQMLKHANANAS